MTPHRQNDHTTLLLLPGICPPDAATAGQHCAVTAAQLNPSLATRLGTGNLSLCLKGELTCPQAQQQKLSVCWSCSQAALQVHREPHHRQSFRQARTSAADHMVPRRNGRMLPSLRLGQHHYCLPLLPVCSSPCLFSRPPADCYPMPSHRATPTIAPKNTFSPAPVHVSASASLAPHQGTSGASRDMSPTTQSYCPDQRIQPSHGGIARCGRVRHPTPCTARASPPSTSPDRKAYISTRLHLVRTLHAQHGL